MKNSTTKSESGTETGSSDDDWNPETPGLSGTEGLDYSDTASDTGSDTGSADENDGPHIFYQIFINGEKVYETQNHAAQTYENVKAEFSNGYPKPSIAKASKAQYRNFVFTTGSNYDDNEDGPANYQDDPSYDPSYVS